MSQGIRLTGDEMRCIALFESITGATVTDCIIDKKNDNVTMVVKQGDAGLAIGKHGTRVKLLKDMLKTDIEIVEYADDPVVFIKKSFMRARVKDVRITERLDNKKIALVNVEHGDKGIAIGKNGKTIERTRFLAKRYFQIDNVIIL